MGASEKVVRAKKTKTRIRVFGKKDPRGPDNTIEIWLDSGGALHISMQKPHLRCYKFKEMIDTPDGVEIIQV